MNFLNSLYYIESSVNEGGVQKYVIRLNPEHVIYKAHFPGEPITPGVCILQIGLELLSLTLSEKLELKTARNVKFLNILTPDKSEVCVCVKSEMLAEGEVKAQIEIGTQNTPTAKMSLICQIAR